MDDTSNADEDLKMTFKEWRAANMNESKCYTDGELMAQLVGWKAGQRIAREECAQICEAYSRENICSPDALICANLLRESMK